MKNRFSLACSMWLAFGILAAEKELHLVDGRMLRGETVGETDTQVILACKVGQISANVRVDKKDILAVKDAETVAVPAAPPAQAPQAAPAAAGAGAADADFARVKRLLAEAGKEATREESVLPEGGFYYGYPYPTWQHWPWLFTLGPRWSAWYGGHPAHPVHHGHGGAKKGK